MNRGANAALVAAALVAAASFALLVWAFGAIRSADTTSFRGAVEILSSQPGDEDAAQAVFIATNETLRFIDLLLIEEKLGGVRGLNAALSLNRLRDRLRKP